MTISEISPTASTAVKPTSVAALERITFDYGAERVLEDVTLSIEPGDFLGIIGPNGSGKTTLLSVLLGLRRPTQGGVRLFGTDVAAFRESHRIGYVPQKATAFEPRFPASVFEVVISGRVRRAGLGRRFGPADRAATLDALHTVGMQDVRNRLIGELSGGQQQRVFIARALVTHPDLLVLDEPTVGVDIEAQDRFYALLRALSLQGTTLVLVSHDIGVVAREVTRLACLNRRLFFHGEPGEALRSGALDNLYRANSVVVTHDHHHHGRSSRYA
ncbi:MAG: metal ABC transporter ATP-binding protein [Armatimonadetes bacterium]|nr:metal ABC transporter ATP-binding protein [Armatimonadota bacterium]